MAPYRRWTKPSNAGPPFTFRPFCAYVERPDMRTFLRFGQVVAGRCAIAAPVAACTPPQAAGGRRAPVPGAGAEPRAVPYPTGRPGPPGALKTAAVTTDESVV